MALAVSSIVSTTIVGAVLLVIVALIIRSMWKKKKSGGGCGCGCSGCSEQCQGKDQATAGGPRWNFMWFNFFGLWFCFGFSFFIVIN